MHMLTGRAPATLRALALALGLAAVGLGGCEKGPAERVGERIDEATGQRSGAERAGDKLEEAGENVRDAGREATK